MSQESRLCQRSSADIAYRYWLLLRSADPSRILAGPGASTYCTYRPRTRRSRGNAVIRTLLACVRACSILYVTYVGDENSILRINDTRKHPTHHSQAGRQRPTPGFTHLAKEGDSAIWISKLAQAQQVKPPTGARGAIACRWHCSCVNVSIALAQYHRQKHGRSQSPKISRPRFSNLG